MKEKKLIASVILGVALVSLITALVASFANALTLFIDIGNIRNVGIHEDYQYVAGGLTLGAVALGIALVAAFFANKKKRFAVNLGLAVALVAYCIVSLIVLRVLVPGTIDSSNFRFYIYSSDYSIFTSYLTSAITVMVSAVLTFAAWFYLTRLKKKEESSEVRTETEIRE